MTLSNVFATLAVLDELSGPGLEVALAVSLRTECEYDARHFVRPKVRTGGHVFCPALDECIDSGGSIHTRDRFLTFIGNKG